MTCLAEGLNHQESSKHDKRESSGAVAWVFWSPSFERTWRQKEPRQCPCVGSTPTRVIVGLVVREIKKRMEKSDVLSAAERFGVVPPLESVNTPLSGCLSQSRRGERQANPCDVRHQPSTLPRSTRAKSVCGTSQRRKEREART